MAASASFAMASMFTLTARPRECGDPEPQVLLHVWPWMPGCAGMSGQWQTCSLFRDRYLADVLRHLVALLRRRLLGDGQIPALDVWILVQVDGLPLVAGDPRPDRDVGDGIV